MLLHLCTVEDWAHAERAGGVDPLPDVGFVHLSTPEQVHLPAQRLFAGRDDVLLLVVDPARLTDPVRFEPGVPGDPASMLFPHLYGRLPATAVVAVLLWEPDRRPPVPTADDAAGRYAALALSLPVRRAHACGDPVARRGAGWAVGSPDHPVSRDDNRLLLPVPVDAEAVLADAAPLVPTAAASVTWCWPGAPDDAARLAHDLERRGWRVGADRVLARAVPAAGEPTGPAELLAQREVHDLWADSWRELLPDDPAAIAQLVGREHRNDLALRVLDVGVREAGRVVAAGQLRVDGGTAAVESLQTATGHRGRGLAGAVLDRLLDEAAVAGCDLAVLEAAAEDWPRHWYARRGFVDVGVTRTATRTTTRTGQAGTSQASSR
ncbi:Uncharacterized conserved protein, DUF952 family [Klenkia marina]|uniref:Uncharacterized conserved protein, DUF952 family n=1 Tax=Klenkia marina TaxID=1960309 RepID=A0A1G4YKH1_9ACTN|nr:GNAT family N-acetyltransferase [Klenkia marina]SCX53278.1 Uncharacterized conserved protein, DUF952 family [Klenkia marina]